MKDTKTRSVRKTRAVPREATLLAANLLLSFALLGLLALTWTDAPWHVIPAACEPWDFLCQHDLQSKLLALAGWGIVGLLVGVLRRFVHLVEALERALSRS